MEELVVQLTVRGGIGIGLCGGSAFSAAHDQKDHDRSNDDDYEYFTLTEEQCKHGNFWFCLYSLYFFCLKPFGLSLPNVLHIAQ